MSSVQSIGRDAARQYGPAEGESQRFRSRLDWANHCFYIYNNSIVFALTLYNFEICFVDTTSCYKWIIVLCLHESNTIYHSLTIPIYKIDVKCVKLYL